MLNFRRKLVVLMENEELLTKEELDELEDVETKEATYEIRLLTYCKDDDNLIISDKLIETFTDPEDAVEYAKDFEIRFINETETDSFENYCYELLVETIVETEPGWFENVGNLFRTIIVK